MNTYEKRLVDELQKINKFPYEDIHLIDKYPLCIAKEVLKVLIDNACCGQNYAPIELGRKKINEINKEWLNRYFLEVAASCIDFSDEWEYRRLVELVDLVVPKLMPQVLDIGKDSENEEVREVVDDYKGKDY